MYPSVSLTLISSMDMYQSSSACAQARARIYSYTLGTTTVNTGWLGVSGRLPWHGPPDPPPLDDVPASPDISQPPQSHLGYICSPTPGVWCMEFPRKTSGNIMGQLLLTHLRISLPRAGAWFLLLSRLSSENEYFALMPPGYAKGPSPLGYQ